ncbi:MAG: hypothetical protein J6V01_04325, partial [Clostridia bacterium]|nr:hypothetical protein [Clostridia bacterium]
DYPAITGLGEIPVALADQKNACAVVYDVAPALSGGNPELKYTFKPSSSGGFSADSTYGNRIDEAKFIYAPDREAWLIGFTSSSGFIGLAEYPSGKKVFEQKLKGYGPHSIDYIPGGLVATALSGNGDAGKSFIRVTDIKSDGYAEVPISGAHAVVWDRERGVLFALGTSVVTAFRTGIRDGKVFLEELTDYRATGSYGGHDLSVHAGSSDRLLLAGSGTYVYNKTSATVTTSETNAWGVSATSVKCFCSCGYGDGILVFRTVATNVYASHDTDRFTVFKVVNGKNEGTLTLTFPDRAFYKARVIS